VTKAINADDGVEELMITVERRASRAERETGDLVLA